MPGAVYSVETPENFVLCFERAGFASRALAQGVDLLLIGLLTQGTIWLLAPLEQVAGAAISALWIINGFALQWGYCALSEWRFAGRTLGKRLYGIAVVDASGLRITFAQAAVRNLLRIVDLLPGFYLLGALSCLLDPHARRLGDLAARTLVVKAGRAALPREIEAGSRPQIGAWGRPILEHMRDEERSAVIALCAALEGLSLSERVSLCDALVAHFARRHQLTLPPQLSAERVLLLVRDGLGSMRPSSARGRAGSAGAQES